MKRILLLAAGIFLFAHFTTAQNGIRVESNHTPVIVYLNNQQMCTPVNSCFISNLNRGRYKVEVYSARDRKTHSRPIFSETVHYKGQGIEEIFVDAERDPHQPHKPHAHKGNRLMSPQGFSEFLQTVKSASFDDTRNNLIKATLATTDFTSEQARELIKVYDFDSSKIKFAKLIYPGIVDKPDFFIVINTFSFESSKREIAKFIEEYKD